MKIKTIFQYTLAAVCFCAACHVSKKAVIANASATASNAAPSLNQSLIFFDKQGHRGCRGLMPENTVQSMLAALQLGVTTLEMDVVITKDKKVILSHENWFSAEITTQPNGNFVAEREERKFNIYWMTYDETKTFDVGLKQHPRFPTQKKIPAIKPLLSDVIDSVISFSTVHKQSIPFFNIETKTVPQGDGVFHPSPDQFIELIMSVIKQKKIENYVIIQSFDFRTLQYLHEHYPNIKTAMLIEDTDKRELNAQLEALGFVPTIYSPAFELVTEKLIKSCHKKNMKIIPWTVNEKEKIEAYKSLAVDGIISDYPNLF